MVIDTNRASGARGMENNMTYRAAYWIAADRQSSVVLTTEDQASLPEEALLDAARAEAGNVGLEIGDGEIVIGEWS